MHQPLDHNAICPIAAFHDQNTCPFLNHEQEIYGLKDFIHELFEDPLRAAKGTIYAVGFCFLMYVVITLWMLF